MIFIVSMALTTFIGSLICRRYRNDLSLIENIFISIFIGWAFFCGIIQFSSNNFHKIGLSRGTLFGLILFGLFVFIVPSFLKKKRSVIPFFRVNPDFIKKVNINWDRTVFYNLISRSYLIVPVIFIVAILLSIIIYSFWQEIPPSDPLFQYVQRGELIYLENNVSGNQQHHYHFYPLHTPILYAWALILDYGTLRIFHLIALMGLVGIMFQNVYNYSKSAYAALISVIIAVSAQVFYTQAVWSEGISNIYCFLGLLYIVKYLEQKKESFLMLGSFFVVMQANTNATGILYWAVVFVFVLIMCALAKTIKIKHTVLYYTSPFLAFYYIPKSNVKHLLLLFFIILIGVLGKRYKFRLTDSFKTKHITYYILAFLILFYALCAFKSNFPQTLNALNPAIVYIKRGLIFPFDIYNNWGGIYGNDVFKNKYHGNAITCMTLSIVSFWESLFFDPQKYQVYNMAKALINYVKYIGIEMWIFLLMMFLKDVYDRSVFQRIFIMLILPLFSILFVLNYIHILFYWCPITDYVNEFPRRSGALLICFIYFVFTNKFTMWVFQRIEGKKAMAYALNIPFLYILLKQIIK